MLWVAISFYGDTIQYSQPFETYYAALEEAADEVDFRGANYATVVALRLDRDFHRIGV
jgi:hypothetical protein